MHVAKTNKVKTGMTAWETLKFQEIQSKSPRIQLLTYSQADQTKFPSRQSFGEAVANEFNSHTGRAPYKMI